MTVVLDTNVLVSALINPDGVSATVLGRLLNGKRTVCYYNRILGEYREVLSKPKFRFKKSLIVQLLDYIRQDGEFMAVEPLRITSVIEDDRTKWPKPEKRRTSSPTARGISRTRTSCKRPGSS